MKVKRIILLIISVTLVMNSFPQPREKAVKFFVDSTDFGISKDIKIGSFNLYWKYKKRIQKHYRYDHAPSQLCFSNGNNTVWVSLVNLNTEESYVNKIVLTNLVKPAAHDCINVTSIFNTDFSEISLGDSISIVMDKFKSKKISLESKQAETILTYEKEFRASNSFLDFDYAFYKEELLFYNGKLFQITLSIE